jgi:hypothetical protein
MIIFNDLLRYLWSYNLLEPSEQTLFRRLSVFVGDCTPPSPWLSRSRRSQSCSGRGPQNGWIDSSRNMLTCARRCGSSRRKGRQSRRYYSLAPLGLSTMISVVAGRDDLLTTSVSLSRYRVASPLTKASTRARLSR